MTLRSTDKIYLNIKKNIPNSEKYKIYFQIK